MLHQLCTAPVKFMLDPSAHPEDCTLSDRLSDIGASGPPAVGHETLTKQLRLSSWSNRALTTRDHLGKLMLRNAKQHPDRRKSVLTGYSERPLPAKLDLDQIIDAQNVAALCDGAFG
jgi:hypothetical protein